MIVFYGLELNDIEMKYIDYDDITSMKWRDANDPNKGAILRVEGDEDTEQDLQVRPKYYTPEEWELALEDLHILAEEMDWQGKLSVLGA